MGYLHIDNLYKNQDILQFRECYAMEKIHGTSANISYSNQTLHLFPGGENYDKFLKLFNKEKLKEKIESLGVEKITIYGEAYGGKQQGMRETYGNELKFIVFEVKIGKKWLSVPQAEQIVKDLELEFIDYVKIPTEMKYIDREMLKPSIQAKRNGILEDKMREGIVLRPLIEVIKNNGERIIAKHKNPKFRETKTTRKVKDINQQKIWKKAQETAEEWVTLMRLNHVLDKIKNPSLEKMREIIITMIEDVKREGDKEIIWSKSIEKAIGKRTARLMKEYLKGRLYNGKK